MSTKTKDDPRDLSEFMKDMDKVPIHFNPAGGPASPTPLTPARPASEPPVTQTPPAAASTPPGATENAPGSPQGSSDTPPATPTPPTTPNAPAASQTPEPGTGEIDWEAAATPRTPQDWKKFKAARKASEDKLRAEAQSHAAKIAELSAKLETYEKAPPQAATEPRPEDAAEIERLKQEVQVLHEKFLETEILADPTIKSGFEARQGAVTAELKQLLGEEGAKNYMEIHRLPEGEYKKTVMSDFWGSLNEVERSDLGIIRAKLRAIDADRDALVGESGRIRTEREGQRTAQQQQMAGQKRKVFDGVVKALQDSKSGNPLFQVTADNPEWNAQIEKRISTAWDLLQGKPVGKPEDVAKVILWGLSTPVLLASTAQQLKAANEKAAALEAQMASMKAAQPAVGSQGSAARPNPGTMKIEREMKPSDVTREFVRSVKAGFGV